MATMWNGSRRTRRTVRTAPECGISTLAPGASVMSWCFGDVVQCICGGFCFVSEAFRCIRKVCFSVRSLMSSSYKKERRFNLRIGKSLVGTLRISLHGDSLQAMDFIKLFNSSGPLWVSILTASSNEPGPDLADYPMDTVPNKCEQLFKGQMEFRVICTTIEDSGISDIRIDVFDAFCF